MGLFSYNYDRPGPGIRKDAPPQKAVPRFFSILQRKFFDLIKLNLLFCIPVAIIAFLIYLLSKFTQNSVVLSLPLIFLSPFIGGLTIVTRNYAREEHAFILSDFIDGVKDNWRSFLINGIFCYLAYLILSVSIPYYFSHSSQGVIYTVAAVICTIIASLVIFGQYYVPVMIVTFDLKYKQILKNSFIFSILGIKRNLLVTLLLAVLFFAIYLAQAMLLTIIIVFLFFIFLFFSYCSYLINFAVYPLIDKMMIQPYNKKLAQQNSQENDKNNEDQKGEESEETEETEDSDENIFNDSDYNNNDNNDNEK